MYSAAWNGVQVNGEAKGMMRRYRLDNRLKTVDDQTTDDISISMSISQR